jgi:hypothetical protein
MSKRINVNPDHYKTAGRLKPGDTALQDQQKSRYGENRARIRKRAATPPRPRRKGAGEREDEGEEEGGAE